jgi:hypothetical protein
MDSAYWTTEFRPIQSVWVEPGNGYSIKACWSATTEITRTARAVGPVTRRPQQRDHPNYRGPITTTQSVYDTVSPERPRRPLMRRRFLLRCPPSGPLQPAGMDDDPWTLVQQHRRRRKPRCGLRGRPRSHRRWHRGCWLLAVDWSPPGARLERGQPCWPPCEHDIIGRSYSRPFDQIGFPATDTAPHRAGR